MLMMWVLRFFLPWPWRNCGNVGFFLSFNGIRRSYALISDKNPFFFFWFACISSVVVFKFYNWGLFVWFLLSFLEFIEKGFHGRGIKEEVSCEACKLEMQMGEICDIIYWVMGW